MSSSRLLWEERPGIAIVLPLRSAMPVIADSFVQMRAAVAR